MNAILIVNADDFGMTEGHNHAIIDAHLNGIVTSTSLLANGYAFDHAVALAKVHPTLGIGVHLTLTEGLPVAANVDVLLEPDGKLPLSNQPIVRALLQARFPYAAIQTEFGAQVQKVIAAGIKPTHIDGHKYIHLLPGVSTIAVKIAQQYNIPVMRVPRRVADVASHYERLPGAAVLAILGAMAYRTARRAGLRTSDRMLGFVDTGQLDRAAIRRLLRTLRPSVTELLCHPAYRSPHLETLLSEGYRWISGYNFDAETAAVSDPALRRDLETQGWSLRSFKFLAG
jgi:predicted glycoside hydrolase/deacetylase ChbG (UPF0249 family)